MDTLRSVCYQLKERVPELGTILSEVEAIVPKIVVVGAQSAGKSLLLNRLLPDFLSVGGPGTEPLFSLPTSAGTCTKFPVTLSFIVTETPYIKLRAIQRDGTVLYDSVVANDPDGHLSVENLKSVRAWINDYNTNATTMFDAEMFLTIGAPNSAAYALVDLPGLTRADPELGPRIEEGVRERVREADIIVVCKQLNADIMDCQAVNIAREERKATAKVVVVSTYADTSVSAQHFAIERQKIEELGWRLALSTTAALPAEEAQYLRQKHSGLGSDGSVLCGSQDLRGEINSCYREMLTVNAPAIRARVMELNKHIQQCLDEIGHEPRSCVPLNGYRGPTCAC
jgi:GTPase SAR1 family protein